MKSKRTAIALVALATIALATPALADEATVTMNNGNQYTDIAITVTEESVVDITGDSGKSASQVDQSYVDPYIFLMQNGQFLKWDDESANDVNNNLGGARIVATMPTGDYVIRATYSLLRYIFAFQPNGSYKVKWDITPTAVVTTHPAVEVEQAPTTTPAVEAKTAIAPATTPKLKPVKKVKKTTPTASSTPAPTPTVVAEPETLAAPKVEATPVAPKPTTIPNSATEKLAALLLAGLLAWYVRYLVGKKKRKKRK